MTKFASHYLLLYVVYMCQKSLNFIYAFKCYHRNVSGFTLAGPPCRSILMGVCGFKIHMRVHATTWPVGELVYNNHKYGIPDPSFLLTIQFYWVTMKIKGRLLSSSIVKRFQAGR